VVGVWVCGCVWGDDGWTGGEEKGSATRGAAVYKVNSGRGQETGLGGRQIFLPLNCRLRWPHLHVVHAPATTSHTRCGVATPKFLAPRGGSPACVVFESFPGTIDGGKTAICFTSLPSS
jgi:hypothetical protein